MRITRYIVLILVTAFNIHSCNLDVIPESDLSDQVFWQTDDDFRLAVNYFYNAIHTQVYAHEAYPAMADVLSDNAVANGFNAISNGTYLPSADFGPWDRDYQLIRATNNILEKLNNYESAAVLAFKAETKYFRAYAYADLVRRYGDVPLIMKVLDTDNKELFTARTPRKIVVDTIYSDLDFAASHLPKTSELGFEGYGYVTSGAALALKSRVALREGTWNKFHNQTNYISHLQNARNAALEVMQSSEYQLFNSYGQDSSYLQLFKLEGEGPQNKEIIWAYIYGIEHNFDIRTNVYGTLISQGEAGISKSLVDAYLAIDGLPIEKSPLYIGRQYAYSEFENRDPRLNGTVMKAGDEFRTGPFIPSLTSITGYQINKYYDKASTEEANPYLDLILIRYGEVLLNYAEATYELNNNISDDDLNISVNLLRDRVGLPHLTNSFVTKNNLNMQEEIRRERRVELGMEGFRYDDLLRWKTAETELPKPILGVRLFAAEYPGVDPSALNLTSDSVVIVESANKRSFDVSKHYLWPLPLNQLALNPNLKQNPEW